MPAGTESRHEFLVHGDLLRWSSTTDVKEETQLGPTVVYSALGFVNVVINVIDDVIEKALQMHLLIYHSNEPSVYNMIMRLLAYNTSGKALITTANLNQHYEVS